MYQVVAALVRRYLLYASHVEGNRYMSNCNRSVSVAMYDPQSQVPIVGPTEWKKKRQVPMGTRMH
jgi:hypothetical protein